MKTLLLVGLIGLCGCSYRKLEIPYKVGGTNSVASYRSGRLGNNEALKRVEFRGPNGESFIIEGWSGNQSESMAMVAEGATRGAVAGFTGQYNQAGRATQTTGVPAGYKMVPIDDPSKPQLAYPDAQ